MLLGGRGLFRGSFNVDVEDVGVSTGDCADASREFMLDGEAVPSFPSLFFFEFLFPSFALDNCDQC